MSNNYKLRSNNFLFQTKEKAGEFIIDYDNALLDTNKYNDIDLTNQNLEFILIDHINKHITNKNDFIIISSEFLERIDSLDKIYMNELLFNKELLSKRFIYIPHFSKNKQWCLVMLENIAYNISEYAIGKKPDIILGYDNYDPNEKSCFKLYMFEDDYELSDNIQSFISEKLEKLIYCHLRLFFKITFETCFKNDKLIFNYQVFKLKSLERSIDSGLTLCQYIKESLLNEGGIDNFFNNLDEKRIIKKLDVTKYISISSEERRSHNPVYKRITVTYSKKEQKNTNEEPNYEEMVKKSKNNEYDKNSDNDKNSLLDTPILGRYTKKLSDTKKVFIKKLNNKTLNRSNDQIDKTKDINRKIQEISINNTTKSTDEIIDNNILNESDIKKDNYNDFIKEYNTVFSSRPLDTSTKKTYNSIRNKDYDPLGLRTNTHDVKRLKNYESLLGNTETDIIKETIKEEKKEEEEKKDKERDGKCCTGGDCNIF